MIKYILFASLSYIFSMMSAFAIGPVYTCSNLQECTTEAPIFNGVSLGFLDDYILGEVSLTGSSSGKIELVNYISFGKQAFDDSVMTRLFSSDMSILTIMKQFILPQRFFESTNGRDITESVLSLKKYQSKYIIAFIQRDSSGIMSIQNFAQITCSNNKISIMSDRVNLFPINIATEKFFDTFTRIGDCKNLELLFESDLRYLIGLDKMLDMRWIYILGFIFTLSIFLIFIFLFKKLLILVRKRRN